VPNLINSLKVAIVGGKSDLLAAELGLTPSDLESCDAALFLVSANDGIDFEDMTAIASKMLDPVVTPHLVLHSDAGEPAALINLETLQVLDYSHGPKEVREADPEHIDLVSEFREEYLEDLEDAGEDSFEAGLLFPALAWVEGTSIGIDQIVEYLNQIPTLS